MYNPQTVLALGILTFVVTNWTAVPPPGRSQSYPYSYRYGTMQKTKGFFNVFRTLSSKKNNRKAMVF